MSLTLPDLAMLTDIARAAAAEAAELIAAGRPSAIGSKSGADSDASRIVTEVDRAAEEIIVGHLAPTRERFGFALLTEEREDDGGRHTADHFWCVDPLDGTLPFVEGRPGHAVSIALVRRDGMPLLGVVHDPVESTSWWAIIGAGAWNDDQPIRPAPVHGDELAVFLDRSAVGTPDGERMLEGLVRVAEQLGLSGVRRHVGAGAVMNAMRSPPGCHVKWPKPSGGGHLWDVAATACIFGELDAVASDIHGDPLDLNRADSTSLNHRGLVFATDPDLAERIRHDRGRAG